MPAGNVNAYDYDRELRCFEQAQFCMEVLGDRDNRCGLTQMGYAEARGIENTLLSRHFAAIRKTQKKERIDAKFHDIVELGADKVLEGMKGADPIEQLGVLAKITVATADRIGFAPQQVAISMQQQANVTLVVPPLFESQEEPSHIRIIDNEADLYPPTKELPE